MRIDYAHPAMPYFVFNAVVNVKLNNLLHIIYDTIKLAHFTHIQIDATIESNLGWGVLFKDTLMCEQEESRNEPCN